MQLGYSYKSCPTLLAFSKSDAFIRGVMGPYGGGKSSACVMEIAKRGLAQRPGPDGVRRSRWAVIRQSYRQLEDSTISTFLQWFPPHVYGDWRPSNHTYTIRALTASPDEPGAEIEVRFRALDRPDQAGNLLSTEYTGAWINEGRDVEWALWEAVMGRVGRYPAIRDGGPTWSGIFSDTNPPDTDSAWYKFFEEQDHSEAVERLNEAMVKHGYADQQISVDQFAACFKQPDGLGPQAENLPNLRPGYYERLAIGKSDDWINVYLRGNYGFTMDGKPVFPEYNDATHCPAEKKDWPRTIDGLPIYRSYDFGLTPACVFSQITPSGRWIVVDELVADNMGFDQFSDQVLEHSAQHYQGCEFIDIGDPAGNQRAQTDEKTCFEIARSKGIFMRPAPQTLRLRLEGTRKPLREMVDGGKPKFVLHPRCKKLRKAFLGGYHYRRIHVSGERYMDTPDKGPSSHVADACTYAGAWLFGGSLRFTEAFEDYGRPGVGLDDRTRSGVTGY